MVAQALTGELTGYAVSTAEVAGLARAFLDLVESYRVPEVANVETFDSHPPFVALKVTDGEFLRMLHPVALRELASVVRSTSSDAAVFSVTSPAHQMRFTAGGDLEWARLVRSPQPDELSDPVRRGVAWPDARLYRDGQGVRLTIEKPGLYSIDWVSEVYFRRGEKDAKLFQQHRGFFCHEFEAGDELQILVPITGIEVEFQSGPS